MEYEFKHDQIFTKWNSVWRNWVLVSKNSLWIIHNKWIKPIRIKAWVFLSRKSLIDTAGNLVESLIFRFCFYTTLSLCSRKRSEVRRQSSLPQGDNNSVFGSWLISPNSSYNEATIGRQGTLLVTCRGVLSSARPWTMTYDVPVLHPAPWSSPCTCGCVLSTQVCRLLLAALMSQLSMEAVEKFSASSG